MTQDNFGPIGHLEWWDDRQQGEVVYLSGLRQPVPAERYAELRAQGYAEIRHLGRITDPNLGRVL